MATSHHECRPRIGGAHEVRPDGAHKISAEDSHDADHHARVNPVIQMRAPAHDELREPRIPPDLVVIQKRLLGEVVGASRARIELCHLRITDRGRKAEQQGEHDAGPHGRAGRAGRRLDVEGEPQEGTGGDQRHRVHRQARSGPGFSAFQLILLWFRRPFESPRRKLVCLRIRSVGTGRPGSSLADALSFTAMEWRL